MGQSEIDIEIAGENSNNRVDNGQIDSKDDIGTDNGDSGKRF